MLLDLAYVLYSIPSTASQSINSRWPSAGFNFAFSETASLYSAAAFQPRQTILPELWDTAVDLFDASRAGVVSDRKRTQKVQEKVRDENSVSRP